MPPGILIGLAIVCAFVSGGALALWGARRVYLKMLAEQVLVTEAVATHAAAQILAAEARPPAPPDEFVLRFNRQVTAIVDAMAADVGMDRRVIVGNALELFRAVGVDHIKGAKLTINGAEVSAWSAEDLARSRGAHVPWKGNVDEWTA